MPRSQGDPHLRRLSLALAASAMLVTGLAAPAAQARPPAPSVPGPSAPAYRDASLPIPDRVDDLMSRMSLDDKLGQLVQTERKSVTPEQVTGDRLGSLLSGGGAAPEPNTPEAWADTYDRYQRAALDTPLGIPLLYGVDAVHGHNNVYGATIFPHNIGLGAAANPGLVRRIAETTAREVAATGIDQTFAPCVCVARDDRWGRTYESFSETPRPAAALSAGAVTGSQGERLGGHPTSIMATAKHYLGDGGTTGGDDQGDTEVSEAELRAIHLPPFRATIARGVGSIMVSYSSWNGTKLHAHRYLVDDVLKKELGFDGIVLSDYDAIDKIDGEDGVTPEEVRTSVNAGLDMIMMSGGHGKFLDHLRAEVQAGRVPMARIDDANRRILTKKFELGLFERPFAQRDLLPSVGSAPHRALARQAVRESQVLLENDGVLPLDAGGGKIFVAGKNADDIGNQSGGWTISWQGGSGNTTKGTTILQGIRQAAGGTQVSYHRHGEGIDGSYRAAIAVVGETPYAEYEGDRPDGLALDAEDRATIGTLRAAGVPVIVVLVSGRPMDIAAEVGGWNALLASWLPGTEGQGVADVLFGAHNPSGTLPMTWMRSFGQQPINAGDGQDPLYPQGYGLRYPAR